MPTPTTVRWLAASALIAAFLTPPPCARAAAPVPPELTDKEEEILAKGDLVVHKSVKGEQARVVTGILDMEVAPDVLWGYLLDFDALLDENPTLKEMECYGDVTAGDTRTISCWYSLSVLGQKIRYYNVYVYRPAESYLTWDLDPDETSDLAKNHGIYQVVDVGTAAAPRSRLFYTSDVETGRHIPASLEKALLSSSLKTFMKSIKKRAESR